MFGASLIQNNANSLGASLLGSNPGASQNLGHSAIGFNRSEMLPQRERTPRIPQLLI